MLLATNIFLSQPEAGNYYEIVHIYYKTTKTYLDLN